MKPSVYKPLPANTRTEELLARVAETESVAWMYFEEITKPDFFYLMDVMCELADRGIHPFNGGPTSKAHSLTDDAATLWERLEELEIQYGKAQESVAFFKLKAKKLKKELETRDAAYERLMLELNEAKIENQALRRASQSTRSRVSLKRGLARLKF